MLLAVAFVVMLLSTGTASAGAQTAYEGNINSCSDLGAAYVDASALVTITANDGTYLSYTATTAVTAVIKGGDNYNVYPAATAGTALRSPLNGGGNVPQISHYLFCYVPNTSVPTCEDDPTMEGCQEEPTCETDPALCEEEPTCETDPALCEEEPTCADDPSMEGCDEEPCVGDDCPIDGVTETPAPEINATATPTVDATQTPAVDTDEEDDTDVGGETVTSLPDAGAGPLQGSGNPLWVLALAISVLATLGALATGHRAARR